MNLPTTQGRLVILSNMAYETGGEGIWIMAVGTLVKSKKGRYLLLDNATVINFCEKDMASITQTDSGVPKILLR